MNLMRDIDHIDERARCSDATFRAHFIQRIKVLKAKDAFNELESAIAASENAEIEAPKKKPRTVRKSE